MQIIKTYFTAGLVRNRAPLLLALLTICMLAVIEIQHPYFFLHDDNLQQNLPYYVHNIRSLLAGEFPLFNFHQFLGTPVFACIQSAALYPPNYVALCISKLFLGHYFGTMEFIAGFHLLLAALGFYRLMRYFGLNEWSCCFGALAWAFCGFVIATGHIWIQMVSYAGFLPWILLFSLRQAGKFEIRSFSILVVLRVLDLYIGYPPYFIYTVTFDLITVSLLYFVSGKENTKEEGHDVFPSVHCGFITFLVKQVINYLCVLLLAAPLLLPALYQIGMSANRKAPLLWEQYSLASYSLSSWLHGLFNPLSAIKAADWAPQPLPFISHIGWLTLVFCFAAFWQRSVNRKLVLVFMALSLFAYLWASDTVITRLFYSLPFYNRQRWPFKLAFFTSFFLIATASFGFDVWSKRIKGSSGRVTLVLSIFFLIHIVNFLSLYLAAPQGVFAVQAKNPPYLEPLAAKLNSGRIATIVYENSLEEANHNKITPLLGFDYATLFDLYHFAGYELLVSEKNLHTANDLNYSAYLYVDRDMPFNPAVTDLAHFRKWGVKWYVLARNVRYDTFGALEPVYRDDNRVVLRDPAAMPLVYWVDRAREIGVSHNFTPSSIRISTERETEGQLIVNVLHNRFFQATIDGKKAELAETGDSQMAVTVPSGHHLLRITYSDPYFIAGLFVASGFMVLLCAAWLWLRFKGVVVKWC